MTTAEVDANATNWSLPGQDDLPRDTLQVQLEVYGETVLLRGFQGDSHLGPDRFGGRNRQRVHPAPGLLLGTAARQTPSGGTREKRAKWWPCGDRPRCGRWPCNGRRSRLPPGSGCPCRGWSSSARRAERPGSMPPWNGPAHLRAAALPRPGLQRLPRRAGLPRQPPLPRGRGADTRILLPVLLLPYRRYQGTVEATPRQPASVMGGT